LWQDGRFYPGSIRNYSAEESFIFGQKYTIQFDDGYSKEVRANDIVGSGFQTISSVDLKHGQKLYLTLNGREVPGVVIDHDRERDKTAILPQSTNFCPYNRAFCELPIAKHYVIFDNSNVQHYYISKLISNIDS
jgi:hypothetical protein